MTTQTLTYSIWKQMMGYLALNSKGTVYYTLNGGHYVPYLVDLGLNVVFTTAQLAGSDQTDFVNNIKPTATLILLPGDAVALAVLSAAA